LHGFSLGPGTPLHGVCVRSLSNESTACPSGPTRLFTHDAQTHQGRVVINNVNVAIFKECGNYFGHSVPEL